MVRVGGRKAGRGQGHAGKQSIRAVPERSTTLQKAAGAFEAYQTADPNRPAM